MSDFEATYEQYLGAQSAANAHNKTVVFDALAVAGVNRVTVPFDGEGDSGQIDGVHLEPDGFDPGKTTVTVQHPGWSGGITEGTETLAEAIETLCYGYLAHEYGGWENNDGAFGEFTLDVAAREVKLEFHARFTDYSTHEHSY